MAKIPEIPETHSLLFREFENIYQEYFERVFEFIQARIPNTQDAQDLTSHVWHNALTSFLKGHVFSIEEIDDAYGPWLFTIARHAISNHWRTASRRPMASLDEIQEQSSVARHRTEAQAQLLFQNPPAGPEASLEKLLDEKSLRLALQQLSPTHQEVIYLKFIAGLSNKEIGQVMGKSEGAVKSLYHRTLLKLRKIFKDSGF